MSVSKLVKFVAIITTGGSAAWGIHNTYGGASRVSTRDQGTQTEDHWGSYPVKPSIELKTAGSVQVDEDH